ncbi:MAG: hypothetical protein A2Z88_09435 [Omnitrophica WOR_2 bacterium GWA2_47_8]|nr:MAG: hypothetical protein A2Z88_09435 [Omnitrophica WOR_2 bacterium GWA2_47_8]
MKYGITRNVLLVVYMNCLLKLWPTGKQWQSWSIPSKHSLLGFVLQIVGIIIAILFGGQILIDWLFPCRIETKINTDIVARLYAKTNINNLKTVKNLEIPFTSQELLYEWKFVVLPNRDDINVIVRLDHLEGKTGQLPLTPYEGRRCI